MLFSSLVTGKIILSGEYAVVFGGRGIAIPFTETLACTFVPTSQNVITWEQDALPESWRAYALSLANLLTLHTGVQGEYTIVNTLPLGKGMGSSTSLVIAMTKSAISDGDEAYRIALDIEDQVNAGHSGLDFACIWQKMPVLFKKGTGQENITIPQLEGKILTLMDAGTPNESTPELVAWVKSRKEQEVGQSIHPIHDALDIIAGCTERIVGGEDLASVLFDHHKAQVALGVVPNDTQRLIDEVYAKGGCAKVIGAGGRTGGGGMVLRID